MEQNAKKIEFRFGKAGKLAPLVVAAAMILWAACSQSNVNGYVIAFFAALMTGVISVAIVALGDLINEIGEKAGVDRYRRANLMDCTGCVFCFLAPWTVHCVIPAQQSAQFGENFAAAPASIPFVNYYSICMLVMLLAAVITGYGRKR